MVSDQSAFSLISGGFLVGSPKFSKSERFHHSSYQFTMKNDIFKSRIKSATFYMPDGILSWHLIQRIFIFSSKPFGDLND